MLEAGFWPLALAKALTTSAEDDEESDQLWSLMASMYFYSNASELDRQSAFDQIAASAGAKHTELIRAFSYVA